MNLFKPAAKNCILLFLFTIAAESSPAQPDKQGISVETRKGNDFYEIVVENTNPFDVTLTLNLSGENIYPSQKVPFRKVYGPGSSTVAFKVFRKKKNEPVSISTSYSWFMGDVNARHNDSYLYSLPFRNGKGFRLGQGPNGLFSHSGKSSYAVDFMMPEGTVVCAAREGVVVKIKDDSDEGGPQKRYMNSSNFIVIRHNDGTHGEYAHFRKNGIRVKPGKFVRRGEAIGESGNTGFSSGPHLHFMVTRTMDDGSWQSVPFKFRTARGVVTRFKTGEVYKAE